MTEKYILNKLWQHIYIWSNLKLKLTKPDITCTSLWPLFSSLNSFICSASTGGGILCSEESSKGSVSPFLSASFS